MILLKRGGWLLVLGLAGTVSADVIRLRSGGTLEGELVPAEGDPDRVGVQTAASETPFVIRKVRIEAIEEEETPLDTYLERRSAIESAAEETAQAHYELAVWCEGHELSGPARRHYKRAVEIDEEFGPAQEKLGRVYYNGEWMTYDALKEAQGLVQHEGKWVTPEERERLQAEQRLSHTQESWDRRIRLLLRKYKEGNELERIEAERQLRAIRDPEAVVPLVNRLGQESPELRLLLAETLGMIEEPIAALGLAHRVLKESEEQVGRWTLNELVRRQADREAVVRRLLQALEQNDPVVIGRAASALAALNAVETVPELIPRLVMKRQGVTTVLTPAPAAGGGSNFSVGFSRFNGEAAGGLGGTNPSIGVLTGPKVAPGAIAFGAQAVPFYGGGSNVEVGAPQGPPVPRRVVVPYLHKNVEVLSALERLTGENFGYNVERWRHWLRTEFEPPEREERPRRRLPQP